jgi:hypothetical protein
VDEVASLHYQAIIDDNYDLWLATLTADNRGMADVRGSSPSLWWQTGRRYAEQYGVAYRFQRIDQEDAGYYKLFFERLNADGSPRGMPVPIHLVWEEDGWRVQTASY